MQNEKKLRNEKQTDEDDGTLNLFAQDFAKASAIALMSTHRHIHTFVKIAPIPFGNGLDAKCVGILKR